MKSYSIQNRQIIISFIVFSMLVLLGGLLGGIRVFMGLFLLCILGMVFLIYYRRHMDLFHPMCFFAILSALRYVPALIYGNEDNFVTLTIPGLMKFLFMTVVTVLMVCLGYEFCQKYSNKSKVSMIEGNINSKMFSIGLILYIIGVASRIYFIQSSGGLLYILANIRSKISLVTGKGYILAFGNLMTYGIIFMMCSDFKKNSRHRGLINTLLIVLIAIDIFLFAFMSDRTAPFRSLMTIVMAYHYNTKRITIKSLLSPKSLALIFLGVVFVVAMPLLRNAQGFAKYGSIEALVKSSMDDLSGVLYWFSYTGRDTFIFQHFSHTNYWYGANILNFLSSPIPASLVAHKLPVDEGYYLANLIMGYQSAPPDYTWVFDSSIPFDNQGIMYANFGFIGLVIGGLITGWVYAKTYRFLTANEYHPVAIVFSQVVIYNFALTSHDMVNVLLLLGFMLIPLYLSFNIQIRRRRLSNA